MYLLFKPAPTRIRDFLHRQSRLPFAYTPVGITHLQTGQTPAHLPSGYVIDHHRIQLGCGQQVYARARQALREWRMFPRKWVQTYPDPAPIAADTPVAILAQLPGLWSLNAARIVYVLEQAGAVQRYGFAYGALPDHAEQGEERFCVEWRRNDDSVWYDILAFSRPNQRLAQLAYPVVRGLQHRFAVDSLQAMKKIIALPDADITVARSDRVGSGRDHYS